MDFILNNEDCCIKTTKFFGHSGGMRIALQVPYFFGMFYWNCRDNVELPLVNDDFPLKNGWLFKFGGNWGFVSNLDASIEGGNGFAIMGNSSDAGPILFGELPARIKAEYGWWNGPWNRPPHFTALFVLCDTSHSHCADHIARASSQTHDLFYIRNIYDTVHVCSTCTAVSNSLLFGATFVSPKDARKTKRRRRPRRRQMLRLLCQCAGVYEVSHRNAHHLSAMHMCSNWHHHLCVAARAHFPMPVKL